MIKADFHTSVFPSLTSEKGDGNISLILAKLPKSLFFTLTYRNFLTSAKQINAQTGRNTFVE